MTTLNSDLQPIQCVSGVMPDTETTPLNTQHYTAAQGVRGYNGNPEKIGGWLNFAFLNGATIDGIARSMFSVFLGSIANTVIGTDTALYSLQGQELTNITPFTTSVTSLTNFLDTHVATLANNPISVVSNSTYVSVLDSESALFKNSDFYTLGGSTTVGGIPAASLSGQFLVRGIGSGVITIAASITATGTATGGGASVVRRSGLVTIHATAHAQSNGDRVKSASATSTGGIAAAAINGEWIIRNTTANTFDYMTNSTALTAVSLGGGTAATYQVGIASGNANESFGQGYGMGKYGVGLYGVSKSSTSGRSFPRIWFFDRFGNNIIATPGNQTGVYTWSGDTSAAPALISGAPLAVNYAFVSNNILVTFGAGGTVNRIFSSDVGDYTNWTASSTNQVFDDNVEGVGQLTSHLPINGINLIFTQQQTYTMAYIGLPNVWSIQKLEDNIGLIGPMARVTIKGVAYWMGQDNFYRWSGGNVEIVPANTQLQSTILNYVFKNLTSSQRSKIFCWYNKQFDEIWWHYPSASDNEPERIARLCLSDMSWWPDLMERTCAEYPNNIYGNPRLINSSLMYIHEVGTDDNTNALAFSLTTNKRFHGKPNTLVVGLIPDSLQDGSITLSVDTWLYPQNTNVVFSKSFTSADTEGRIAIQGLGRFSQYTWSGAVLGQGWKKGMDMEYVQPGATS